MIAGFFFCGAIKWRYVMIASLLLFVWSLSAQTSGLISGIVINENGEPLSGATVTVKGTVMSVSTDGKGEFRLQTDAKSGILVVSFTGFVTTEFNLDGKDFYRFEIKSISAGLEEVVVVGYGTQKRVNLTGSVSSVSAKDIEDRPITQASQALAGLATGVSVSQGAGRPGNDGASVRIRGLGTFSGAGNEPLVLIDGLAASLNDIDPNNIKSISVLKDAASASIYGTRAANGVILVETKRGSSGRLMVNYNNTIGWQRVTELPDFVNSGSYAELFNEANTNMGRALTYTQEEINKFNSGSDPDNYPNVPHLKNLLNSGSGFQTNHNLGFSGGNDQSRYLFSLGYLNQDGIVAKNNYQRYNFLLNFDSEIFENLKLKVNVNGNTAKTAEPKHFDGDMMHMIGFAVRQGPIYAGRKSDGTYGYQDNYSPEAWMSSESFVNRANKFFLGGAELAWELLPGLTWSGKAGYNYSNYTDNSFTSNFVFDENKTVGPNNLNVSSGDNSLITLQSLVNLDKKFGTHVLNLLGGYSEERYRSDWTSAFRDNFPSNLLHELNAGASSNMQSSGSGEEWALRSFFGRAQYNIDDRYLLEANARYDGTSRFPGSGRWGLFPSISAGWRISEESFFKNNVTAIDNLKLRASWGQLGNQNIGNYPYQNVLNLGYGYPIGDVFSPGARLVNLANADITWETTTVTDIGVDLTLLNGKLDFVVDYFDKYTDDILYNLTVSGVLGLTPSEVNAAAVRNRGIELMARYSGNIGKVGFSFSPNFTYTKNRVTRLAGDLQQDIAKGLFVGHSLGAIYGYSADGLFVNDADVADYATQPYAAEPGFVRYADISGPDGVPDGIVDPTYDRQIIGNTVPKYSFGATLNLDYRGFDASLILHGLAGFERQMGAYQAFAFYNGGQIQQWQADGRWTAENPDPNADYIKLSSLNMGSGTIMTSTFWNRNASFLRVKNAQIGYSFGEQTIKKIGVSRLRVFLSGQNLLSFNSFYRGWDPEMNQATGDNTPFYPITSVYTFGVNVNF
ncbi:SusC/RagA family TonB-linked outer membrane protein [Sphingobacterium griseoflavum]|uniref:SusC/RagA family TonB-linked outer membrane protein n=1 Tax=Sphingobacterium griseoflavum TaxID=1474952 RepID=A0ABQ3HXS3_9SPHI|nr:TonB-dependent receptor [Sphingobacterium griseoflavum]GHE45200.1 SusC/RagA family TonB-linked outer membrane protein [Sphingobacterium griseoflavum]